MGRQSEADQLAELQSVNDRLQAQGNPRAKRCLDRRDAKKAAQAAQVPKRVKVREEWRQDLRDDYIDARATCCQHCLAYEAQAPTPASLASPRSSTSSPAASFAWRSQYESGS